MVKNNDYDNLREEILYSRKAQDTFTMFLYTSVITILGFAFELQNLYLFLLPIIIIVPVAIKVADYRRTIAYIAAYMIVFLENDYNKWETDNFEFSKIYPRKGMEKLMEGRTSFVIAHRLSTIRDANTIIVMKDGDIVEIGNHDELLEKGGFYASLYQSQFEGSEI